MRTPRLESSCRCTPRNASQVALGFRWKDSKLVSGHRLQKTMENHHAINIANLRYPAKYDKFSAGERRYSHTKRLVRISLYPSKIALVNRD